MRIFYVGQVFVIGAFGVFKFPGHVVGFLPYFEIFQAVVNAFKPQVVVVCPEAKKVVVLVCAVFTFQPTGFVNGNG